jgi:molybdopterin converting factor small subunit
MNRSLPLSTLAALDALLWDGSQERGFTTLGEAIVAAYTEAQPDQITASVLASDLPSPLEALARSGQSLGAIVGQSGAAQLLWVPDPRGAFVASLWPTAHEGVHILIGTVPVTDRRWRRLERWVANAAPRVFVPYLTEEEFTDLLSSLSSLGETQVSRVTARTVDVYSSRNWAWRADRYRPRPAEALSLAAAENASPRTVALEVVDVFSLHLRRDSGATLYGGNFPAFEDVVLGAFVRAAHSRLSLLSGRQRGASPSELRPIRIKLATDVFEESGAIDDLVQELSARGSSVALLHRNPYLHMAVTNYVDGSNADAFIFAGDEIIIFPGYAASPGALARLAATITERFAATEVSEAPAFSPPSREDLVTAG